MNEETLRLLQEISAASLHADDARLQGYGVVALPGNTKLESLERFQARPNAMRAAFSTTVPEEFARYIGLQLGLGAEGEGEGGAGEAGKRASVFVNPETLSADAVLDYGTHSQPGWGRHTATLERKTPAALASLLKLSQAKEFTRDDFLVFLEDFAENVADGAATLKSWRKVEVSHLKALQGETQEASTTLSVTEKLVLGTDKDPVPTRLRLDSAVSEGLTARSIEFVVSPAATDRLAFRLRIVGWDRLLEEAAKELSTMLDNMLGDSVAVYVGKATGPKG